MRLLTGGILICGMAAILAAGCSRQASGKMRRVSADNDKGEKKEEKAGAPFELPSDKGGQLLAEVLPPRQKSGATERLDRRVPATVPAPRFVEVPATLPAGTAVVTRLTSPVRKDILRPRLVVNEGFDGMPDTPTLPTAPSFEADKPVAVPAEDVSIPAALPILSQPTLDRIPIDDFTLEASTAAVLTAPLPRRETPAPFAKEGVPEPFENRKPLPTKPADDEDASPITDGPAVPKK